MHALILAGGFATRLWPLTEKTPKPLVRLGHCTILDFLVEKIPVQIPVSILINSFFAKDFAEWKASFCKKNPERRVEIFIENSQNESEKLGALFAVSKCVQDLRIKDDVLVLAGDNFFDFALPDFLRHFAGRPTIAVFDVGERAEAKKFGVVVPRADSSFVADFQEKPDRPKSTLVSTGICVLPKDLLENLHAFALQNRDNLGGIFEHFLQEGIGVQFVPFSGKWFDVGSFKSFLQAFQSLNGARVLQEGNVHAAGCEFSGAVFLGSGSRFNNTRVENSIVFANCKIENAEIRNCVICKNSTVLNADFSGQILRENSFVAG